MGLKADIEPGGRIIIGDAVVRCERKRGGRTRLEIIAPKKTRIVPNPTDLDVDATVRAALSGQSE